MCLCAPPLLHSPGAGRIYIILILKGDDGGKSPMSGDVSDNESRSLACFCWWC